MNKKFLLSLFFIFVYSLTYGIGISPTRYVFLASHNETCKGVFTIVNDHNFDMPVVVEIREGIKSKDNKNLLQVRKWLKVEKENFVVPPGQRKDISFKLKVPKKTSGTFSARLSFVDKSQSSFSTSMTVPIYIIVKGTEIIDWSVEELIIKNTPVGVTGSLVIENRGNVIFYAIGNLIIKDKDGKEIFKTLAGGGNAVFPESKVITPLNLKDLKLELGKYYAEIIISGYNNEKKFFEFEIVKTEEEYKIEKVKK